MKLLDEEMDGVAREQRERLESIDGELEEVKNQLGRVWHFIARSDSVDVAEASDLIVELRERKEKLEIATEEARALLKERRQFLDSADTIAAFAAEMSDFLKTSELTETKAFVGSFVKEVVVKPGRAAIVYSIPTPDDSPMGGADAAEIALNGRVMNSVRHGGLATVREGGIVRYEYKIVEAKTQADIERTMNDQAQAGYRLVSFFITDRGHCEAGVPGFHGLGQPPPLFGKHSGAAWRVARLPPRTSAA